MAFLARNFSIKILVSGIAYSGTSTISGSLASGKFPPPSKEYVATLDYERVQRDIAGIELTIFDLGGQTAFQDRFTSELAEFVFSGIKAFVWVLDSFDLPALLRAKYYFDCSLVKISQFSPDATIFVFQHKTDLIPQHLKGEVRSTIYDYLSTDVTLKFKYYETSMLSNSVFRACRAVLAEILGDRHILLDEQPPPPPPPVPILKIGLASPSTTSWYHPTGNFPLSLSRQREKLEALYKTLITSKD